MMNEHMAKFMQKQDCATICCVDNSGNPYCFNCFYAFNKEEGLLFFKSSEGSYHTALLQANPHVAGSVLPNKLQVMLVKGVQFEGIIVNNNEVQIEQAKSFYYKKHPMAIAVPGEIWTVQILSMKMTDNTQGFGKKIHWEKERV